jgi:hypothetical protein
MNTPTKPATAITAAFALAQGKEQIVRQTILRMIAPNQFLFEEEGGLASVETRMFDGGGVEVVFSAPYGPLRPLRHILDELFVALDAASRPRRDEDWGEGGG